MRDKKGRFVKGSQTYPDASPFKKGHTPWNKNKGGYSVNISEETKRNRTQKT